jgi:hypothetical protein
LDLILNQMYKKTIITRYKYWYNSILIMLNSQTFYFYKLI